MYEKYKEFKDRDNHINYLEQFDFFFKRGKWSQHSRVGDDLKLKHFVKDGKLTIRFDTVYNEFNLSELNMTTLEGSPVLAKGTYSCSFNDDLTDLKGSPQMVQGDYICTHNKNLTSLEGAPQIVNGYFLAHSNKNLKSAFGIPSHFEWEKDCLTGTGIPKIEREFIEFHRDIKRPSLIYTNYYSDLLHYVMKKDASKIVDIHWSEEIKASIKNWDNLIRSGKTVGKYKL